MIRSEWDIAGVYPLLGDATCWFLAVDFDKSSWVEDVRAFRETCRELKLPVAVERSRSGNGAHAWFFFAEPVMASSARRMGSHLITRTMARRHQLSMGSYDRLFPSQDTVPRGGFGNLIALPLQQGPRQMGNSVFVDDDFVALPGEEQWTYLASVSQADQRITPATVELVVRDAVRAGQVVGLTTPETDESVADTEKESEPWALIPVETPRRIRIPGPLPTAVRAVLAHRLFVEKAGLPSPLLDLIKRLAAFQNPMFYKQQAMRLSTALIPRVIARAEELDQHITLPRACLSALSELLGEHDVALEVRDERILGEPLDETFRGELTPLQLLAGRALMDHDTGVFVAPPGIGKTVVGTWLIAQRARSTLVLVDRRPLMDQWIEQLSLFLGVETKAVGRIGAGKYAPNGKLDVAMLPLAPDQRNML